MVVFEESYAVMFDLIDMLKNRNALSMKDALFSGIKLKYDRDWNPNDLFLRSYGKDGSAESDLEVLTVRKLIHDILNDDSKQSRLIGAIFDSFKSDFATHNENALKHWFDRIKVASPKPRRDTVFSAFNTIKDRKAFDATLLNVLNYAAFTNFEMFIDLVRRFKPYYVKKTHRLLFKHRPSEQITDEA